MTFSRKAEAAGFAGICRVRSGFTRGSLTPYQRTPETPGPPRDPLGSLGGFTPLGAASPTAVSPRPGSARCGVGAGFTSISRESSVRSKETH